MTWLKRYQIRSFIRNSIWLFPAISMVFAIALHRILQWLHPFPGWEPTLSPNGARALLGTLSASLFTFIGFVFSILLLSVQLASAQLTPRIIAFFYRTPVIKFSLTIFVFTFAFTLAVLSRIEESVYQLTLMLATYSSVVCIGIFLYMIDKVGKSLRPISLMNEIGSLGGKVIMQVYPHPFTGREELQPNDPFIKTNTTFSVVESNRSGVLMAFDIKGLTELARLNNCVIELIPQTGAFITSGEPLFHVYPDGNSISHYDLNLNIAIGSERTLEQDPEFAFRIIVDIASKALSPAINDPTTGVIALDQIHRLLKTVSGQQLYDGRNYDAEGSLRLVYRTPDWDDFISLAITEIRHYGGSSLQIVRRLRNMLEKLIAVVPPQRVASLQAELEILDRAVTLDFREPADQVRAKSADSIGIGGSK